MSDVEYAVGPELDAEPADDDRPEAEVADQLVDQRNNRELPLRFVLELQRKLELGLRIRHARSLCRSPLGASSQPRVQRHRGVEEKRRGQRQSPGPRETEVADGRGVQG